VGKGEEKWGGRTMREIEKEGDADSARKHISRSSTGDTTSNKRLVYVRHAATEGEGGILRASGTVTERSGQESWRD
jgi:hypothetical protein